MDSNSSIHVTKIMLCVDVSKNKGISYNMCHSESLRMTHYERFIYVTPLKVSFGSNLQSIFFAE